MKGGTKGTQDRNFQKRSMRGFGKCTIPAAFVASLGVAFGFSPSLDLTSKLQSIDRRLLLLQGASLTVSVAAAPPAAAAEDASLLDEVRTQIDLAVQASSVQAFADAAELANDSILGESTLSGALKKCSSSSSIIDTIAELRMTLNKEKLDTGDTMAVMKYGTSARATIDACLEAINATD